MLLHYNFELLNGHETENFIQILSDSNPDVFDIVNKIHQLLLEKHNTTSIRFTEVKDGDVGFQFLTDCLKESLSEDWRDSVLEKRQRLLFYFIKLYCIACGQVSCDCLEGSMIRSMLHPIENKFYKKLKEKKEKEK